MFEQLEALPDDPILSLIKLFREDLSTKKVDLGAGVYQNEAGQTEVLPSVKRAEAKILEEQTTKTYEGLAGSADYNTAMQRLVFGDDHAALRDGRVATVQTTGGSGGLHVAARVLAGASPGAKVWLSEPTWPNHGPLLASAGIEFASYPYLNLATQQIDFDAMLGALAGAPAGDVVLLHGCCHNPSGADLSTEQWRALLEVVERRGLVPFIDMAYQGFAEGVAEDAYGVRLFAAKLPEVVVVTSCSKNFGLYRERVGTANIVAASTAAAVTAGSHLASNTRRIYSMPPAHGAAVVATILNDERLRAEWLEELAEMRTRINALRRDLAATLAAKTGSNRFDFVADQRGMFSLLGLSPEQVGRLRDEFHVYMVGSSRTNIAGVREANLDYLSDAIAAVL